jgi:hypothetical protein
MYRSTVLLLFALIATPVRASEELELIRLALFQNSGLAASGRPLDHKPLVSRKTVAPNAVVQQFTAMIIKRALAGTPTYADETTRAFAERNSTSISLDELPLREGSDYADVDWTNFDDVLAKHGDREGVILVFRPVIAPDTETAFVTIAVIEREFETTYVHTYRRTLAGQWDLDTYASGPVGVGRR